MEIISFIWLSNDNLEAELVEIQNNFIWKKNTHVNEIEKIIY